MKKLLILIMVLLGLFLAACGEDDDDNTPVEVMGYKLQQFVDKGVVNLLVDSAAPDTVDYRNLFAYQIIGADGFNPRQGSTGGYDLSWPTFKDGYLVPSQDGKTLFPNTPDLPGAYKVRNAAEFKLYRKVDVSAGRGSKQIELWGLPIHTDILNWNSEAESSVKLSDLLGGIAAYDSVKFVANDASAVYTPAQVNDGYYLLTSERTTFPTLNDSMDGLHKKFKRLAEIVVYGATIDNFTWVNADTTHAAITITIPTDLSTYTSESVPGL